MLPREGDEGLWGTVYTVLGWGVESCPIAYYICTLTTHHTVCERVLSNMIIEYLVPGTHLPFDGSPQYTQCYEVLVHIDGLWAQNRPKLVK